ncbi:MAG TPA: helicase, partial [Ktedonobacteraceae bacterium]|nr:helicase [Ktedonobacteraceae bacterium]
MNIIKLPPVLPGELNLEAANLSLQAGEATLDWSQVEEAPENLVAVLLADLDLVDHSEILGINTVPDSLSEIVLQVLTRQDNKSHHGSGHKRPADNDVVPAAWEPEQQVDLNGIAPSVEVELPRTMQTLPEPPRSILQLLSPSALRDELERLVLQDLLGPAGGSEEEVDEGSVRDRYLVGALAPRDQQVLPEEMDERAIPEEGSVEDGANDDAALQIASLYPSSIGMSFSVDGTATSLSVEASWGSYRREHSETIKTPKGSPKMVWKRQQIGERSKIFSLKEGPVPPWSPEAEEQPDVIVRGLIRRSEDS